MSSVQHLVVLKAHTRYRYNPFVLVFDEARFSVAVWSPARVIKQVFLVPDS